MDQFSSSVLNALGNQLGSNTQSNFSGQSDLVNNIVPQLTTNYLRNRSGQVVNQTYKTVTKFLKREEVFPKGEVRAIEISPDGQRIVCLIKEGKTQYLKNISNKKSSVTQVIKEKYPINDFVLFGKYILYTYYDKDNTLKVKARTSLSASRLLNLPRNLKSVRFFKNNSLCMAECYDGEEYTLYSIKYDTKKKKFLCKGEKRLSGPTQSLFNRNLNPVLTIKYEDGVTNVYFNQDAVINKTIKRKDSGVDLSNEDAVENDEDDVNDFENSEDSEDSANLMLVGQIQNPNLEKYFSVDKDNSWYTATLSNNILIINRNKITRGTEPEIKKQKIYELKNVPGFSQVKINTDQNGRPSFVSVNNKKYQHFAWDNTIKRHLNVIGNRFNYASWYRVNTTSDGNIWLICVMSDKLEKQFFLYDTRNHNFAFIQTNPNNNRVYTVNDYNVNKFNLRPMSCHYFSSKEKELVKMFFIRGVKSTTSSPLIVMTNSSEQYSWSYMPMVQILANRGFNILCLNYRKSEEDFTKALQNVISLNIDKENESREDEAGNKEDDERESDSDDDEEGDREEDDTERDNRRELSSEELEKSEHIINVSIDKASADIRGAISWAIKNRLVKQGNVILLAEKHSVIPAMQLFLKNQASFVGCIAVDPSEDDMNFVSNFDYSGELKPTVVWGRFNNSESVNTFLGKISDNNESNVSVISSNNLINQKLTTGIVEAFLAKIFTNKKVEPISQTDINSLSVIQDGLDLIGSSNDVPEMSNWR